MRMGSFFFFWTRAVYVVRDEFGAVGALSKVKERSRRYSRKYAVIFYFCLLEVVLRSETSVLTIVRRGAVFFSYACIVPRRDAEVFLSAHTAVACAHLGATYGLFVARRGARRTARCVDHGDVVLARRRTLLDGYAGAVLGWPDVSRKTETAGHALQPANFGVGLIAYQGTSRTTRHEHLELFVFTPVALFRGHAFPENGAEKAFFADAAATGVVARRIRVGSSDRARLVRVSAGIADLFVCRAGDVSSMTLGEDNTHKNERNCSKHVHTEARRISLMVSLVLYMLQKQRDFQVRVFLL